MNILPLFFQSLAYQIPVLLVSLVACIVTILNWHLSPRASMFSLLGFGCLLAICFLAPLSQSLVQYSFAHDGSGVRTMGSVYAGLGAFWSILRAVSYGLILAAVYAGRSEQRTISTPPPPQ